MMSILQVTMRFKENIWEVWLYLSGVISEGNADMYPGISLSRFDFVK